MFSQSGPWARACFFGLLAGWSSLSLADALPPAPVALRGLLASQQGAQPQDIAVYEPHLNVKGQPPVRRVYRGFPIAKVLNQLLGADWPTLAPQRQIEFIALDGFVARIPVERLLNRRAYLVYALADGGPFVVDNKAQGEKDVALGPYYLVWDNMGAPELLAEGGALWPYQVSQIRLSQANPAAVLLPASMAQENKWAEHAALAQKYCLSCHQVNGFGGDKMPLNLAVRAKLLDDRTWFVWLLTPQAFKPGTSMPPLAEGLPQAQREDIAAKLHAYFVALPVLP